VASPLEGEEIHDAKNRLKELRQRRGGGSN
jgi:hypothetical protein